MGLLDNTIILLKMAFRNVLRQKRRSAVVAATASIGILGVLVSQGFINAFYDSMVLVAVDSGLGHVQIRPGGYLDSRQTGLRLNKADQIESDFQKEIPDWIHYAPRMEREAILRIGAEVKGVLLLGVDVDKESEVSSIPDWVVDGTFFGKEAKYSKTPGDQSLQSRSVDSGASGLTPCMVGVKNALFLEVEKGDRVVISTGGTDGSTRSFLCEITAIFHAPSSQLDEALVIMRRSDLSRIRNNGPENEVSYFVFRGVNMEDVPVIKKNLIETISGNFDMEIATMHEMEPSISALFELYDQVTVVFYFIILVGFGIILFESVTMSIFERMQEIGIMHAIGSRPSFLFWLVIFEAFILAVIGTIFGIVLGSITVGILNIVGMDFEGLAMGAQAWSGGIGVVHPYLNIRDFFDGLVIALTVSFFSGMFPAWRAVRLSPLQAIYNR